MIKDKSGKRKDDVIGPIVLLVALCLGIPAFAKWLFGWLVMFIVIAIVVVILYFVVKKLLEERGGFYA